MVKHILLLLVNLIFDLTMVMNDDNVLDDSVTLIIIL